MTKTRTCAVAAAVLLNSLFGVSNLALAIDDPNPKPPATQTTPPGPQTPPTNDQAAPATQTTAPPPDQPAAAPKPTASKKNKSSSAEDFLGGYHAAYALIYDRGDFEGGIGALHALGHDDNADVATLLGYASRKLGRYDDAKHWYEAALAADPNHAVTWSYYGMWQAEQGNILKAKDDLEKVRQICGTDCRAYTELKAVIEGTRTY
jgi:tetratricopeptide (TPR) repeat protein